MKLAEALTIRADIQSDIATLKSRIMKNAQAKEGGRPSENPRKLIERLNAVADDLQLLIRRINKTNAATEFEPGLTLIDALAMRDSYKLRHNAYSNLGDAATVSYVSFYRGDAALQLQGSVEVSDIRDEAQAIAKQYRALDMRIQAKNWATELLE